MPVSVCHRKLERTPASRIATTVVGSKAEALHDAALNKCHLEELMSWLRGVSMPWRAYIDAKRRLAAEKARKWSETREKQWWALCKAEVHKKRSRLESDAQFRDEYIEWVGDAKEAHLKDALSCPNCGTPPDELFWLGPFVGKSCGWTTFCEKCNREVDFFSDPRIKVD